MLFRSFSPLSTVIASVGQVFAQRPQYTHSSVLHFISTSDYDYVIYPDYLREDVNGEDKELVEIPTHNFASKNPFERVELRYSILEKLI